METTCAGQRKTKKQLQYAEDATLNRDLHKTPRELKIDLIGYYQVTYLKLQQKLLKLPKKWNKKKLKDSLPIAYH